jgi:prepilin signal peptidase PulO-like enzyme (type II secretory pathway)
MATVALTNGVDEWSQGQRRLAWGLALVAPPLLAPTWIWAWRSIGGSVPSLMGFGTMSGLVLVLLVATSAITDERSGKIRNWTTFPAFFWGVTINLTGQLAASRGWEIAAVLGDIGIGACLIGALVCFSVMVLGAMASGTGMGDVKLATAVGALLGWERGLVVLLFACVGAVIVRYVLMLWQVGPWVVALDLSRKIQRLGLLPTTVPIPSPTVEQDNRLRRPIRLGIFFALGTLLAVLGGSSL